MAVFVANYQKLPEEKFPVFQQFQQGFMYNYSNEGNT